MASKTLGLAEFCAYVEQQLQAIHAVQVEIEEVQLRFDSARSKNLQLWQTTMAKAVPLLAGGTSLPSALAQGLLKVVREEQVKLEQEIATLTAKAQSLRQSGDATLAEAQAELTALREQNPELDAQEEGYKAHCSALRQVIQGLDAQIKQTGFLTGILERRRLRKQRGERQRLLKEEMTRLREVRRTWAGEKKRFQAKQDQLHARWEQVSTEASQVQARIDYLQANIEQLSQQNGAAGYLAELRAVPEAPEPLHALLAEMVDTNHTKDEYEEGLQTVSASLGLLKGLAGGMARFAQSANNVLEEQRRYNLRKLRVQLDERVLAFHAIWPQFSAQVKDEKDLGARPSEFSRRVRTIIDEHLSNGAIAASFESMGNALNQATKAWH